MESLKGLLYYNNLGFNNLIMVFSHFDGLPFV